MFACSWKTAGMAYCVVFVVAVALKVLNGLPDLSDGGSAPIYSGIVAQIAPLV